jgi:hypothetical protein
MALNYGSVQSITITAGSLASNGARSSAAVTTSTTNNITDAILQVNVLTTATAPSGNKQVVIYGYGSNDGTDYGGNSGIADDVDGTDKALTAIGSPTNLRFLGTIQLNQGASAQTIKSQPISVAAAFGGFLPKKWGIVLHNDAGTALGATVTAEYTEVYYN